MHFAGRRRSQHNPLRSVPLYRSADFLRLAVPLLPSPNPVPAYVSPWAPPSAAELQRRELASAEAILRDALRVLDGARAEVEDAKRTTTREIVANGRVVGGGLPLTPKRIRQRKAQARRLLAKRLAGMAVARGRVEAARAVLGLPSLVDLEDCAARAAADEAARVAFKALGVLSNEGR